MIEISIPKYWIECTFDEIQMYLQFLEINGKIDWNLFSNMEEFLVEMNIKELPIHYQIWTISDFYYGIKYKKDTLKWLIPIRHA